MRTLSGVLVGAIILGLAGAPQTAAFAADPTAPFTAVYLDNGSGGWLGKGSITLDPSNSTASVITRGSDATVDTLSFNFYGSGGNALIGIDSGSKGRLVAGMTYSTSTSIGPTTVNLSVFIGAHWCDSSPGTMTVKELGRDAVTGVINVIAVSFVISPQCDPQSGPTLSGELRWNSTIGYRAAQAGPDLVDFGPADSGKPGKTKPVTVTSTGSEPTTFGAATTGGTDFLIAHDGCAGVTLSFGGTCTVSVTSRPTELGEHRDLLTIPDSTIGGKKVVTLRSIGIAGPAGTYYLRIPQRLLDTRTGNGAPKAKVAANGTVELQVTGRGGVPLIGVAAVVLNVTATQQSADGYLTVWPTGVPRPDASSLNFAAGVTRSNSVTVPVGEGGKISLFNAGGTADLLVDVNGFYADSEVLELGWGIGGQFFPHEPTRILDTRDPFPGNPGGRKLPANKTMTLPFTFGAAIDPHVRSIVVNITATEAKGTGYVTVWDGQGGVPPTSTLNIAPGATVANMAIIQTRLCGQGFCPDSYSNDWLAIALRPSQDTHLLVDVVGFMDDSTLAGGQGLRFRANTPTRIANSRDAVGLPGRLDAKATGTITAPAPVADDDTVALAMNVTAYRPTASTYLMVWEAGTARPWASNLNPAKNDVVANAAISMVDADNRFSVFNAAGSVDLIVDVVGSFYLWSGAVEFSANLHGGMGAMTAVPPNLRVSAIPPALWRQ